MFVTFVMPEMKIEINVIVLVFAVVPVLVIVVVPVRAIAVVVVRGVD